MGIGLTLLFFIMGLFIIVKGGDLFVDGAVWLAYRTKIPAAVIGATIVSVATTLPEFFVSTVASNEGYSEMALGNSLGSVICNIALVLGICILIRPIEIKGNFFVYKGFMMIGYLLIFLFFTIDRLVSYKEGLVLIFLFLLFIVLNIIEFRKTSINNKHIAISKSVNKQKTIKNLIKFMLGAWFIIIGAHILVDTGVEIAYFFKIPNRVISLTLLALGTSLPELVTSVSAIIKKEESISVGNILGANILNLTIVLGFASLVSDTGLLIRRQTIFLDLPIALLIMVLFVFSGIVKKRLGRGLGILLLAIYFGYLMVLF